MQRYDAYDILDTEHDKDVYVLAAARPYNQDAAVGFILQMNAFPNEPKPHLYLTLTDETDENTLLEPKRLAEDLILVKRRKKH